MTDTGELGMTGTVSASLKFSMSSSVSEKDISGLPAAVVSANPLASSVSNLTVLAESPGNVSWNSDMDPKLATTASSTASQFFINLTKSVGSLDFARASFSRFPVSCDKVCLWEVIVDISSYLERSSARSRRIWAFSSLRFWFAFF